MPKTKIVPKIESAPKFMLHNNRFSFVLLQTATIVDIKSSSTSKVIKKLQMQNV